MKLRVVLDYRFAQTPDGQVWSQTAYFSSFWQRYLTVFDQVQIVARAAQVAEVPANWQKVTASQISFGAIPNFLGPKQYLFRASQVRKALRNMINDQAAVIMRVPSQLANDLEPILVQKGHPYALEVIADPWGIFAAGAVDHPLRPFFRWWFTQRLRQQCLKACALVYVTQFVLQQRYPAAPRAFSTHFSSVELPDEAFVSQPRSLEAKQGPNPYQIIFIGSMRHRHKAPDTLLEACALCLQTGIALRLVLIGEGKYRPMFEAQAKELGITEHVQFLGQVSAGDAIRQQLDQADLFVLPSKTEGLPRAMLEAMARGLPCICSNVGGIPELLPPEALVPPGDAVALAQKIREILADPMRMAQVSAQNLAKAKLFHEKLLNERRIAFYRAVKEKTKLWLAEQSKR